MEFLVHYHEVNPQEQSTPLTLLYYLEDAAIAHSESVGNGVAQIKAEGLAWILNRWHLQMDQYPKLGEKVILETWSSSFERFYGRREFLIRNEQEDIIGQAADQRIEPMSRHDFTVAGIANGVECHGLPPTF